MTGTQFVLYAELLPAYSGAVAARIEQERQGNRQRPDPARHHDSAPAAAPRLGTSKVEQVEGTTFNLRTHPAFAGLGEIVTV